MKIYYLVLSFSSLVPVLLGNQLWAAEITGGLQVAQLLAASHGFKILYKSQLGDDIYILEKDENPLLKKRTSKKLQDSKEVLWAEEQVPKNREKRGMFSWLRSRYTRVFNDALWNKEWYMQDYRDGAQVPVLDLNVVPCYMEGITGTGVRVTVIDDGLEWRHVDIASNYDPSISFDFNDNDTDPTPRYDPWGSNSHGTKCAGEIAMVANNRICGVGIAYNASIGGLKLLDGPASDLLESEALSFNLKRVDIYSNSWGPPDDGRTMEGPGILTRRAFFKGVKEGRDGKGSIYVFAAGNGKGKGDNCGADGYINTIYTIAIASASQEGKAVYYGERCSAILATAYSSGANRNEMVATTNLNNTCTLRHTGTSAAAPLAAGIIALLLQANNNLTWRDVQYLIIWTAEVAPLSNNPSWNRNAAGFWVSSDFGFGLLNAHNMIRRSRTWRTVPEKHLCIVPVNIAGNVTIFPGTQTRVTLFSKACRGTPNEINYLEHVELRLSLDYFRRGSLSIHLTSPSGFRSTLLEERFWDEARIGLNSWTMSSVHFWGERPAGFWTFTVGTRLYEERPQLVRPGRLRSALVVFHGTKEKPSIYDNGPREYAPFYLP
ncbi:neuroendocrine convertase 1 [Halyomorpha halys]|uniref:neuroendocrine convertase 1 n=1 Tax=Halyomorpha halys TaxID=286706 RepID=UPI0006D4E4EA|nr:neuroendocrine convertase 1-like [Halyomorpha halys]XP_014280194.1 neuroendocrine convertase 1-like [Halyomorpha halys]